MGAAHEVRCVCYGVVWYGMVYMVFILSVRLMMSTVWYGMVYMVFILSADW